MKIKQDGTSKALPGQNRTQDFFAKNGIETFKDRARALVYAKSYASNALDNTATLIRIEAPTNPLPGEFKGARFAVVAGKKPDNEVYAALSPGYWAKGNTGFSKHAGISLSYVGSDGVVTQPPKMNSVPG